MFPLILYTGQPNRTQEQRTETIPGKEPVCEPSRAASDTCLLAFGSPGCCVLNQLLLWGRGLDILLLLLLNLILTGPRSFLPQGIKLTVWTVWSCMGSVR